MIDLLIKMGVPKQSAGDVWLLILFIAIGLILVLMVKRRNLGGFLISIYIAFAVTVKTTFDFLANPNAKTAYFIVLTLIIFSLFKRLFKISITGKKVAVWMKTILFSLATTGLLVSVVMSWFPQKVLAEFFSPVSIQLFVSGEAQFIWVIAPLILVLVFKYQR